MSAEAVESEPRWDRLGWSAPDCIRAFAVPKRHQHYAALRRVLSEDGCDVFRPDRWNVGRDGQNGLHALLGTALRPRIHRMALGPLLFFLQDRRPARPG